MVELQPEILDGGSINLLLQYDLELGLSGSKDEALLRTFGQETTEDKAERIGEDSSGEDADSSGGCPDESLPSDPGVGTNSLKKNRIAANHCDIQEAERGTGHRGTKITNKTRGSDRRMWRGEQSEGDNLRPVADKLNQKSSTGEKRSRTAEVYCNQLENCSKHKTESSEKRNSKGIVEPALVVPDNETIVRRFINENLDKFSVLEVNL